jgi:hypothetical protein
MLTIGYSLNRLFLIVIFILGISFLSVKESHAVGTLKVFAPVSSTGTVNLTTLGTYDWAHWGHTSTARDYKSGGPNSIGSPASTSGSLGVRFATSANNYTWTDGTPNASATTTATGNYWNVGYSLPVALNINADTTVRTLHLFMGGYNARIRYTFQLSDGSAPAVWNWVVDYPSSSSGIKEWTIIYQAGSASQVLTVTAELYADYGSGQVSFGGAYIVSSEENTPTPTLTMTPTATPTGTRTPTPVNDFCSSAITISSLPYSLSTNNAASTGPDIYSGEPPVRLCGSTIYPAPQSLWWSWLAPSTPVANSALQIEDCGSGGDTIIDVLESSDGTCSGTLTSMYCADGYTGAACSGTGPDRLRFVPTPDINYFIRISRASTNVTPVAYPIAVGYVTMTPTPTASNTPTPTSTVTETPTKTATPTPTATFTGQATPTPYPTKAPTAIGQLFYASGPTTSSYNLTTLGAVDWAHYCYTNGGTFNHKSPVVGAISDKFTNTGAAITLTRYASFWEQYTWTDGTPNGSVSNSGTGCILSDTSNSIKITVAADTTLRNVHIIGGAYNCLMRITATLSDASAPPITFDVVAGNSQSVYNDFNFWFQAASAGQTLTISREMVEDFGSGNVTMQAVYEPATENTPTATTTPNTPTNTPAGTATKTPTRTPTITPTYCSNSLVPHNMSSNTAPIPYVASSSGDYNSSYYPYKAFDGLQTGVTYWYSLNSADWMQIDLGDTPRGYVVENYKILSNAGGHAPKNWTFKGSNDNTNWTTLDTQTNQTGWATVPEWRTYTVNGAGAYRYYRLDVTADEGSVVYVKVIEMEICGAVGPTLTPTLTPPPLSRLGAPNSDQGIWHRALAWAGDGLGYVGDMFYWFNATVNPYYVQATPPATPTTAPTSTFTATATNTATFTPTPTNTHTPTATPTTDVCAVAGHADWIRVDQEKTVADNCWSTNIKKTAGDYSTSWSNASNAVSDDNSYASAGGGLGDPSYALVCHFPFTPPDDAIITGLTMKVRAYKYLTGVYMWAVLVKNDGNWAYLNCTDFNLNYENIPDTETERVFGAGYDNWGCVAGELTPSRVKNDAEFGPGIETKNGFGNGSYVYIDSMSSTLTWCEPPATPTPTFTATPTETPTPTPTVTSTFTPTPTPACAEQAPHNMSADDSPAPYVVTADGQYSSGYAKWKAFDGDESGAFARWMVATNGANYLSIDLGTDRFITEYGVVGSVSTDASPKNWTFRGSGNGTDWTTLDTQTNQTGWAEYERRNYTITGDVAYRYYRLYVTADNGNGYLSVAELYLCGSEAPTATPTPTATSTHTPTDTPTNTPTNTPTDTPTPTPTPTPTLTPLPTCHSDSDCPSDYICVTPTP